MVNEWIRLGRVKSLCPWALVYNESGSENGLGWGSCRVASDGAERDGSKWKCHGPKHLPPGIASCAVGVEVGSTVPLSCMARPRAKPVCNLRLHRDGHRLMGNACMDGRSRSLPTRPPPSAFPRWAPSTSGWSGELLRPVPAAHITSLRHPTLTNPPPTPIHQFAFTLLDSRGLLSCFVLFYSSASSSKDGVPNPCRCHGQVSSLAACGTIAY